MKLKEATEEETKIETIKAVRNWIFPRQQQRIATYFDTAADFARHKHQIGWLSNYTTEPRRQSESGEERSLRSRAVNSLPSGLRTT